MSNLAHDIEVQSPAKETTVARRLEVPTTPAISETTAIIQVIERAAMNSAVDIDKMERLLEMQERIMARNAKSSYAAALSAMQPKLPVIAERGKIIVKEKGGERIIQSTSYALWEDINEAIRPALAEHGFALSFRTGLTSDGKISVTGVLSHAEGHQEETMMVLPHDSTGSKNAVQAVGSSTSYGKRYTAMALLNLTSRGEDDDGKAGGSQFITKEQVSQLQDLIIEVGADPIKFLAYGKVNSLAEIPASDFEGAVAMLEAKRRRS